MRPNVKVIDAAVLVELQMRRRQAMERADRELAQKARTHAPYINGALWTVVGFILVVIAIVLYTKGS